MRRSGAADARVAGERLLEPAGVELGGRVVRGRVQRGLGPVRPSDHHLLHPRLGGAAAAQPLAQLVLGRDVEGADCQWTPPPGSSMPGSTTAPSSTASCTADSLWSRGPNSLNTMLRTNTTITVAVMLDPKITWKFFGKLS